MKKFIIAFTATGMMLGASAALAQDSGMYVSGTGDKMMVMGGNAPATGAMVMGSKDKCTAGVYYKAGDNMVSSCDTGGGSYDISKPDAGMMMKNGKAYPEGAMMMKEHKM
jgi:hypothetical protein